MYLDVDWNNLQVDEFLIIECYRGLDGEDYSRLWNDSFLKPYLTSLIKRQWGMNLIKFQGVKLPGGIEFNGRQIYDDAENVIIKNKRIIEIGTKIKNKLPDYQFMGIVMIKKN